MEMLDIKEIQSPEDFTDILRTHGMDLSVEESMSELRKPISAGEKTIPNRICIQPLEGYDSCIDGSPSDLVYRRYQMGVHEADMRLEDIGDFLAGGETQ